MSKINTFHRVSTIVNVLAKQGLGYFVQEYGFKWHLPFVKRFSFFRKKPEQLQVRLRKAMEELGGTYIKLGQLLSIRPDLVPRKYCEEFKKLLDDTPPLRFAQVRKIIETEMGKPIEKVFSYFEEKPIGSASIAQVHQAKLKNGKKVVVKVQRPYVKEDFDADIQIMYYFARKVEKKWAGSKVSPTSLVQEFERYSKRELNFIIESRNIDKFYQMFKNKKNVIIPKIYWQYSSSKIIVMDYLEGIKLSEVDEKVKKVNIKKISKLILDTAFDMLFEHRFFHADLHPGNIVIMKGDKIGILDFGIIGSYDKKTRKLIIREYAAVIDRDIEEAVKILTKIGKVTSKTNIEDFKRSCEIIINEWYGTELREARVTRMLYYLFNNCVAHHIQMPVDLILLGKALVTLEGTELLLNPDFNFVEYSKPKIIRIMKKENHPKAVIKRFFKKSSRFTDIIEELPEGARIVMDKLKKPIQIDIDDIDVHHLGMNISTSSNRLAYALIIAALLITGSQLISSGPYFYGYSFFSIASFSGAGLMSLILLDSIYHEKMCKFIEVKK